MKKFSLVLMILGSIIFLTACGSSSAKTTNKIKIGASPTPTRKFWNISNQN